MVDFESTTNQPYLIWPRVRQAGGTYQQALGSVLLKLEAAHRDYLHPGSLPPSPDRDHSLIAAGLEWGFTHLAGSDSTFLFEIQNRFGEDVPPNELPLFQRDVLVGYRFALNDVQDRRLLLTAIVDLEETSRVLAALTWEQRLFDAWGLRAGARYARYPDDASVYAFLDDDDHVHLSLTRFF